MARAKRDETIAEILRPIRRNDLQARRCRLKLSRVALARFLDVDPATVFRQERGVMSALWDYAMRGVEGEAKLAKLVLQSHQARVDSSDLIPDAMVERGHRYTGEKMKRLKPRPKRVKVPAVQEIDRAGSLRTRMPSRQAVTAAADRAEARSRLNKST
jgi:DNA-binding XRE family transcriptional regulator